MKALATQPTPIAEGTLAEVRARLRFVPSRAFRVRLRRHGLDYDHLRLNSERLIYSRQYGPSTPLFLNHLAVEAEEDGNKPIEVKNTGAGRLLPDDVDFTKTVLGDVRDLGNSSSFGSGLLFLQATEEDVFLDVSHLPDSNFSAEATLTFGVSEDGKNFAVNPQWDVAFFGSKEPTTELDHWLAIFEGEPTFTQKSNYINFDFGYWEFGPPGQKLPRDYFGVVARSEVDLPRGDYLLHLFSDDGARVLIDGQKVLSGWPDPTRKEVTYSSEGGKHLIHIQYIDYAWYAHLYFRIIRK